MAKVIQQSSALCWSETGISREHLEIPGVVLKQWRN